MRSSASIVIVGAALAAAAPAPQDIPDLNALAAALPSFVSELGPLVTQEAQALGGDLASLQIPGVNPTAVVSDLPAFIASNLPAWESAAIGAIPSGLLSPAELAAISASAPDIFSQVAGQIDAIISELPQTLPVTALGPFLASELPALESAALAEVSSLVPEASSVLTALQGEITGGPTPTLGGTGVAPKTTASASKTGSAPIQTFTGAANANGWGKEVMGAAAVVGFVGAML
ncbi:hypothetical protein MMC10_007826 [Thelotrema lepadinum]|nr:hypothetical protein [Thelotrema lepadinum]